MKLYMFRTVPLSNIRNLFTVQSAMIYVIQVCRQLSSRSICSCSTAVYILVWHIPLLNIQWIKSWWWTEELSETCRFSWQNKFVKLMHLFGFIIKKFGTMHGHMKVKNWKWRQQASTKRQYLPLALCLHHVCESFISLSTFVSLLFMFAIYKSELSGVFPCEVRQVTCLSPQSFVDRYPVIQLSRVGQITLPPVSPQMEPFNRWLWNLLTGLSQVAKFNIL